MSRAKASWIRWWKFNAVGAMGIVVQLVALTVLKSGLHALLACDCAGSGSCRDS